MANNDGFFKGFVLGGLIGSFVGLMLAPKTGKEFREDLSEESGKFFEKAKKDFEMASKAAAHSYEKGRDKFMEKIVDSEKEIDDVSEKKKHSSTTSKKEEPANKSKPSKKSTVKK